MSSMATANGSVPPARMAHHFWANDNIALHIILDRLQRSKRTCETILKMFEKRAQIEQEYGEKLMKLSQLSLSEFEEPHTTMSEILESVPTATEATARAHADLAQQIHHLLETPLATFIRDQKASRKTTIEQIDRIQNLKYMHLDNVKRAQAAYESEQCKLAEARRDGSKSVEEIHQKAVAVDHEYKLSVGILESVTNNWIDEWERACDVFQHLEERRLEYLSATLLAYANMITTVYTVDDQSCERIRAALENMNVAGDINTFIQTKSTGTQRPEIPKYLPKEPPSFTVSHAAARPRAVHEINIPVVDEELRSVNDQLKKLPSRRPTIVGEKAEVTPPPSTELTKPSPVVAASASGDADGGVSATTADTAQPLPMQSAYDEPKPERKRRSTPPLALPKHPVSQEKALPSLPPLDTRNLGSRHPEARDSGYLASGSNKEVKDPEESISVEPASWQPVDLGPTNHRRSAFQELAPLPEIKKKKNKSYGLPFLKKSSKDDKPRFSLGLFKKQPQSKSGQAPLASSAQSHSTSPHSASFPPSTYTQHDHTIKSSRLDDGTPILEYVQALWSYDAKIDSEISFVKDDILAVIDKKDDGWWEAQVVHSAVAEGSRGLVPGNFMGAVV
ncbi:hypothetical protein BCR43DRAFT_493855 [Syncephalastrum racemosum]|uniref:SH3 domain-containing protein n=1 Tax=Syncephalastrum racemosum TaxID=13706 RepID=A0A1X2HBA0_SYNRA|nr:hypothetical protein BCR43DRAFT_493855 [Syncephalastrum racemosum]